MDRHFIAVVKGGLLSVYERLPGGKDGWLGDCRKRDDLPGFIANHAGLPYGSVEWGSSLDEFGIAAHLVHRSRDAS